MTINQKEGGANPLLRLGSEAVERGRPAGALLAAVGAQPSWEAKGSGASSRMKLTRGRTRAEWEQEPAAGDGEGAGLGFSSSDLTARLALTLLGR